MVVILGPEGGGHGMLQTLGRHHHHRHFHHHGIITAAPCSHSHRVVIIRRRALFFFAYKCILYFILLLLYVCVRACVCVHAMRSRCASVCHRVVPSPLLQPPPRRPTVAAAYRIVGIPERARPNSSKVDTRPPPPPPTHPSATPTPLPSVSVGP